MSTSVFILLPDPQPGAAQLDQVWPVHHGGGAGGAGGEGMGGGGGVIFIITQL